MTFNRSYQIAHITIQVRCDTKEIGDKTIASITDCFWVQELPTYTNSPEIVLRFRQSPVAFQVPETAQNLFESDSLKVQRDNDNCYITAGDSIFYLAFRKGEGEGYLAPTFFNTPPKSQQQFLMLVLLWLFREYGLYGLHSNGLAKGGCGLLLIGDTCSGKSTTAMSLIRQGWLSTGDDVTLLRNAPEGVEAIAFLKGFSLAPRLTDYCPELQVPFKNASLNGDKMFVDINGVYLDCFISSFYPKTLIFPQIADQGKSELLSLDKTSAMVAVSQNCGGTMVDKEVVKQQMKTLGDLIAQTESYQFIAGRDVYEKPNTIPLFFPDPDKQDIP